jgi:hypothetical protein
MSMFRWLGLAALVVAYGPWATARAHVYLGVGVGGPCYYRPHCGYGYGWYRPYGFGVYVAPPPVVIGGPPVVYTQPAIVQQPVVVQPAYQPSTPPPAQAPAPLPPPVASTAPPPLAPEVMPAAASGGTGNRQADIDACLQQLRAGDEQARADALVQLGRLQATGAIGPMVKALNSDASPKVREAAARGLGLTGSPSALSALQYAAQSDDDREVRHSAAFAAESVRGTLRR